MKGGGAGEGQEAGEAGGEGERGAGRQEEMGKGGIGRGGGAGGAFGDQREKKGRRQGIGGGGTWLGHPGEGRKPEIVAVPVGAGDGESKQVIGDLARVSSRAVVAADDKGVDVLLLQVVRLQLSQAEAPGL